MKNSSWVWMAVFVFIISFAIFVDITRSWEPGDVDNSGEIDIVDYSMVKLYINDEAELNRAQYYRADIDRDGDVDDVDYACIREIIWGGE